MNIDNTKYLDMLYDCMYSHSRPAGGNSSSTFFNTNSLILIYGGTMPTSSAFDSGWSSLYEPGSGSELLCKYTALYSRNSTSSSTIDIDTIPTSGVYVADGTATWAAILPAGTSSTHGYSTMGTYTWDSDSTNPIAMLCDVSEPSGDGIVQLLSTTVSTSAPGFYTSAYTIGV